MNSTIHLPKELIKPLIESVENLKNQNLDIEQINFEATNFLTKSDWYVGLSSESQKEVTKQGALVLLKRFNERKIEKNRSYLRKQLTEQKKAKWGLKYNKKNIKKIIAREFLFILTSLTLSFVLALLLNFPEEIFELAFDFFIAFNVLRYLYYAVKWSIKTLKE